MITAPLLFGARRANSVPTHRPRTSLDARTPFTASLLRPTPQRVATPLPPALLLRLLLLPMPPPSGLSVMLHSNRALIHTAAIPPPFAHPPIVYFSGRVSFPRATRRLAGRPTARPSSTTSRWPCSEGQQGGRVSFPRTFWFFHCPRLVRERTKVKLTKVKGLDTHHPEEGPAFRPACLAKPLFCRVPCCMPVSDCRFAC
jgi:hypothetical protein